MNIEARERLARLITSNRGGRSFREYGKLLGVSGTTIQDWETLRTVPTMQNLTRLAPMLGYTVQELLNALGQKPLPPAPVDTLIRQVESLSDRGHLYRVIDAAAKKLAVQS